MQTNDKKLALVYSGKAIPIDNISTLRDNLKALVQLLVTVIEPIKIYMIDYREVDPLEKHSYMDLLIVIANGNQIPFVEMEPFFELMYLRNRAVSCSLHGEGMLIAGLREGHIVCSLHCVTENLIYDNGATTYPVTNPETVKEMKAAIRNKYTVQIEKALDFNQSANFLRQFHPIRVRISTFMLHQAVELTYKAILQSLGEYCVKAHSIRVLKKHVRRCANRLNSVFPDNTEEERRLLDLLDGAYFSSRYEDQYSISEADLSLLFDRVNLLLKTAEIVIEAKLGAS